MGELNSDIMSTDVYDDGVWCPSYLLFQISVFLPSCLVHSFFDFPDEKLTQKVGDPAEINVLLSQNMATLLNLTITTLATWMLMRLRRKNRRRRRLYVRKINLTRPVEGEFSTLINHMRNECEQEHFGYFRMSKSTFDQLLTKIHHRILHHGTHRIPISSMERFAVTLRYLASGNSFGSLAYSFRIDHSTVSQIVHETTSAIWDALQSEVLQPPDRSQWQYISQRFMEQWQFPACLGAIDGKHVSIKNPPNAGSQYFNYKHYFSIVILAVADADYLFRFVDIGGYGREGDAGLFHASSFGQRLSNAMASLDDGGLDAPADTFLPNSCIKVPHVFIGDAAFPLQRHLIKPYAYQTASGAESVYNYRLSRARRIVENAFGIMVARWRVLQTRMELTPKHAENVVKACVVLHNFLKMNDANDDQSPSYVPVGFVDSENDHGDLVPGGWRDDTDHGYALKSWEPERNPNRTPYAVREKFKHYFVSDEGAIPWQSEYASRGEY